MTRSQKALSLVYGAVLFFLHAQYRMWRRLPELAFTTFWTWILALVVSVAGFLAIGAYIQVYLGGVGQAADATAAKTLLEFSNAAFVLLASLSALLFTRAQTEGPGGLRATLTRAGDYFMGAAVWALLASALVFFSGAQPPPTPSIVPEQGAFLAPLHGVARLLAAFSFMGGIIAAVRGAFMMRSALAVLFGAYDRDRR